MKRQLKRAAHGSNPSLRDGFELSTKWFDMVSKWYRMGLSGNDVGQSGDSL